MSVTDKTVLDLGFDNLGAGDRKLKDRRKLVVKVSSINLSSGLSSEIRI